MIEGYQIKRPLFTSSNNTYLDSVEEKTGERRLIQYITSEQASLSDLAELKNDYEISGKEEIGGILKSVNLVRYLSGIALVKEFYEGIPLSEYFKRRSAGLIEKVRVAIQLAEIVRNLHQAGIVHRDLRPGVFLVNTDELKVRLMNVKKASSLAVERILADQSSGRIEGELHYISPEQTGRMNRSIDYRTDIYSLGVVLYELFGNRLPFDSRNALEIIYAHIARTPPQLHELQAELPEVFSDIVLKMLSKNAEDRYQTAAGVVEDLQHCLKELQHSGRVDRFEVGRKDLSAAFNISEKLYGRNEERRQLIEAFHKAKGDMIDMVLVTGYSGIGKTRLINEIYKPLAAENGNFISGKFDQYSQNSPYEAFIKAIRMRVRQLLAGDSDEFRNWNEKIQSALGENGKLLVDLVPELEVVIGTQPELVQLGPNESQARFLEAFEFCLGALASKEKPLVLFIDDLQWADAGSLDIIYSLLSNRSIRHVLLIGAYRDNEVDVSHPLNVMLNRLSGKTTQIEYIRLKELPGTEINFLLADSLRLQPSETEPLSELIMGKTGGNPFFVKQFLEDLVAEERIYYDKEDERWRWKLDEIGQMRITDNVVDLLMLKLNTLSEETREVLRLASAIGSSFDLHSLASLLGRDRKSVSDALWQAASKDFIQAVDQRSRHFADEIWEQLGIEEKAHRIGFLFAHDKIRQAAYSLIPEESRKETHLKIGRLMQAGMEDESSDRVFDIAGHFNIGLELVKDERELTDIARLNLRAGNIAKNSNSYPSALEYFQKGMEAIEADMAPELYRDILIARSECEYLCGNYDDSERMYEIALEKAGSDLEKAGVYAEQMKLYENTARNAKAIKSALQGLKLLGINLPEKPGTPQILFMLLKAKFYLRGKSMEDLKALKNIESPKLILSMKIMINLWGPAYLHNPNLLVLAILKMVILSARHGNAPESALAYAFFGFINCAQLKSFEKGYEFGQLGIWLNEKFDDRQLRSKVYVIFAGCTAHWRDPLKDTYTLLKKAYETGQETNDLVYAGYALNFTGKNLFFQGDPLDSVAESLKIYVDFCRKIQSKVSLNHLLCVHRMVYRFLGASPDPALFGKGIGDITHEQQVESLFEDEGVSLPWVADKIYSAYAAYFFGEYEKTLELVGRAEPEMVAVLGLIDQAIHNFLHSASLLALARQDASKWKSKALKKSASNQKLFRKWAENAPENWRAMYLMVEAERALVRGRQAEAAKLYQEAKRSAEESGLIQYAALLNERMARLYEQMGMADAARLALRNAYIGYSQWGATGKAEKLQQRFPELERINLVQNTTGQSIQEYESTSSSSIDLQSIFKASTTISGEVEFEQLLEKLLRIVMENAGAQSGTIIRVRNGRLYEVAAYTAGDERVKILDMLPLNESEDVPRSIVRFGFHSSQPVIVEDPLSDNRFGGDPYIRDKKPRSVLCQPIIQSGQIIALIYLENRLAEGAFTPARLEVLNLLSGQIAVSLQNAELYKAQQELNRAYQRFVPLDFIQTIGRDSILDVELGDSISDEMTVMFCDIRSYTSLSEGLSARESFTLINDYLKTVGPIIVEHHGFINHYLGDGFVALFKDDPADAIRASIRMFADMEGYNSRRVSEDKSPLRFGIGLHKGPVMLGIIGDQQRHDANVLSDAVNISSRLEGLTRDFGSNILTSADTIDSLADRSFFHYRSLGRYRLKGKEEPIELIEIIDADDDDIRQKKLDSLDLYTTALEHFAKGDLDPSRRSFTQLLAQNPDDTIARRFVARIDALSESGLPEGWDGTARLG